jgi:serine/threonine-protein kinase RsbT
MTTGKRSAVKSPIELPTIGRPAATVPEHEGAGMLSVVEIRSDVDIVTARQQGRMLAIDLGLAGTDAALVATAISELARNIVMYAGRGRIALRPAENGGRPGVSVIASDEGPGIVDIEQAMQLGYSTSGSLGLGLPGVRRLMDEFELISEVGKGTKITVTKWKT